MMSIYNILIKIISYGCNTVIDFVFKIYVKIKFNNIWQLKEYLRLNYPKIGGGKRLLAIYDTTFSKYGSWIGHECVMDSIPFFPHGFTGVFISNGAKIGKNCIIFQQVTIGSNTIKGHPKFGSPTIGNNVYIGAGAKIIGNIKIGDNCRIGANAVVVTDIEPNTVAVPETRLIIKKNILDNKFYSKRNNKWCYYDFNKEKFVSCQ